MKKDDVYLFKVNDRVIYFKDYTNYVGTVTEYIHFNNNDEDYDIVVKFDNNNREMTFTSIGTQLFDNKIVLTLLINNYTDNLKIQNL